MKITVASTNPVKIESVRVGFLAWMPDAHITVTGIETPSGISRQPMTAEETYQGAENRANAARALDPQADFWVGVEGGVEAQPDGLAAFAWIVVLSGELRGIARSASFSLPASISDLILQGIELGTADDILFGRENSKRTNGAVGLLTNDLVTRTDLYSHAVVLALIPFMNPKLYSKP